MTGIGVRPMIPTDWADVQRIYWEGITTGHATFEAEPPGWEAFNAGKVPAPRLVAIDEEGVVIGWAAASRVSARPVYWGVVEHSVYVAEAVRGRGVGGRLLAAFIDTAHEAGIWTIQSSLFPENTASLRLHHQHGFRTVGTRERIALMTYGPLSGTWRDTVLIEHRRR